MKMRIFFQIYNYRALQISIFTHTHSSVMKYRYPTTHAHTRKATGSLLPHCMYEKWLFIIIALCGKTLYFCNCNKQHDYSQNN